MSKTQTVIDDYISRLREHITDLAINEMPDSPSQYALKHQKGEILVQYVGSEFAEPDLSGGNYPNAPLLDRPQRRRINIQLTLVIRSLRGAKSTTARLDDIRNALKKFRPADCLTQVYFVAESFISETQGIWQYGIKTAVELWEI